MLTHPSPSPAGELPERLRGPWGLALLLSPLALLLVKLAWNSRRGLPQVQELIPILVIVAFLTAFGVAFWLHWKPRYRFSETFLNQVNRAEEGDPEAQFQLGLLYRDGLEGFPKDAAGARYWIDRAASRGHGGALRVQAEGYLPAPVPRIAAEAEGSLEQPPDRPWTRSLPYLILIAVLGTLAFVLALGLLLFAFAWSNSIQGASIFAAWLAGIGLILGALLWVHRSRGMRYQRPIRRLFAGAEGGKPGAQRRLAQAYLGGMPGLPRDPAQAIWWMGKAAAQGDVQAAYLLAQWLDQGIGQGRNRRLAKDWLKHAAEAGHGPALVLLRRWKAGEAPLPETGQA